MNKKIIMGILAIFLVLSILTTPVLAGVESGAELNKTPPAPKPPECHGGWFFEFIPLIPCLVTLGVEG
ncbi:MAG: hypothetical protein PHD95_07280 [Candidatus ainarchaeum sp.]|nr:hypothetical protein [Candidatus ainarchaeum sp.]